MACYAAVVTLAALANLASAALTVTIQRGGIVRLTGDNRGQLAGELCRPGHHGSSGPRSRPGSGNMVDEPANQVSERGSKVAYKRGCLESNRPRFESS